LRELVKINIEQQTIEENDTKKAIIGHTPLGVAVGIVPWNCELIVCNET